MSNQDNKEKSKKSFAWLYWVIGLLVLKFVFPAVVNMMNKPNQEQYQQRQIEQQLQQERRQQLQREQYRYTNTP